ncbi:bacterial Ig-like domain-containing protein [Lactobacillus sp. YT155]|uniref:bacterial Ig-like domain-containing protein n=1 Tax=Lactobacillus sp. YT155 TaxID=3060955 RepID=UPI00265EEA68|nr:bacterial Ig-like domain-containing protein [Lactobacillus sp. YT155]MDO1605892.1 bacterial Ig-like domain-containing protein [Lactobacillus sp. YT155]
MKKKTKTNLLTYSALTLLISAPVLNSVQAFASSSSKSDNASAINHRKIAPKSNIANKTNKIPSVTYPLPDTNGDLGNEIMEKGINRAKDEQESELQEQLSSSDWNTIRTMNVKFTSFQSSQYDDGFRSEIPYGKIYLGVIDAKSRQVIGKTLIYDSVKDQDGIPTSDELKGMNETERSRYILHQIKPLQDNIYIKDQETYKPDLFKSQNGNNLGVIYDGMTSDYHENSTSLKLLNIGPADSSTVGNVKDVDSSMFSNYEAKWGDLTTSYRYWRLGMNLDDKSTGNPYTLSAVASLKNSSNEIFTVGNDTDSRITNPIQLLKDTITVEGENGEVQTVPTDNAQVSWYKKPDTTKVGTNSAILQLSYNTSPEGTQGITYLRVPYEVKNLQPVTVRYIDEEGNSIHDDQIITGNSEGEAYDASTPQYKLDEIKYNNENYHLDINKLPDNASGIFGGDPITVTYTYKRNQTAMVVHNSEIYVGDEWKPQDNWDSTLDMDGNSVDFDEIERNGKIEGEVNTLKPGVYEVTYSYQDSSAKAIIIVKPTLNTPTKPVNPNTNTPTKPVNPNTNTPTKPVNPKTNTPTNPVNPYTNTPTIPENPYTNTPTIPENPYTNTPTIPENPYTNTPTIPENPYTNTPTNPVNPNTNTPTKPVNPNTNTPTKPVNPNTNTPTKPVNPKTNTPTKPVNPNTNTPTKPVNPNTNTPTKPVNPNTNTPTKPVNPNTNTPTKPVNPNTNTPTKPVSPNTNTPTKPVSPNTNTPTRPVSPNTNTPTKPVNPNTNTPTKPVSPNTNTPTKPVSPKTNTPTKPVSPNTNTPTKPVNPNTNTPTLPADPSSSIPKNDDNNSKKSLPKTGENISLSSVMYLGGVLVLLSALSLVAKKRIY